MNTLRPVLAVAAAGLAFPGGSAPHAQEIAPVLTCEGPISRHATHTSLSKTFGARNVSFKELQLGEGETEMGSVLFGSDPKRRIEILWNDRAKRSRPRMVVLGRYPGATDTLKDYHWRIAASATSVPLGLRQGLSQVEAVNGRSFELAGFEWDYSGTVLDWKGGALAAPPGGCRNARFRRGGYIRSS